MSKEALEIVVSAIIGILVVVAIAGFIISAIKEKRKKKEGEGK